MSKRPVQKPLFRVLTVCLIVCLMGGGIALLYQFGQGAAPGYASSESVVGEPSLTAAFVDTIFRRVGSPMVGTGKAVEAASQKNHIDDAFALAVWWVETNDGAAGVGLADNNPGSVRGSTGYPEAYDGYTIYPTFTDAVNYWFSMMKKVYINRGLTTVSTIAGPYVGTSTSNLWAGKVINLMQSYRAEAPPRPTPTPTVSTRILNQARDGVKHDAPIVQPQAVKTDQSAPASTSISRSTQIVVLLDLIIACVLAGVALSMNRRYSSITKLAGLLENDLPAKIRSGIQESYAHSNALAATGSLSNTENLVERFAWATSSSTTGSLASSATEELFSTDLSALRRSAFALPQTQNLMADPTEVQLPFSTFQAASLPPGAHSTSPQTPEARPAYTFHKTRLQSSVPETDLSSWNIPQPVGAGASAQTSTSFQGWQTFQPVGAGALYSAPAATSASQTLQPVGAGSARSNGLLSRYREMQAQNNPG